LSGAGPSSPGCFESPAGNPTIADVVLERLVHGAHRLELKRENMRKPHSAKIRVGEAAEHRANFMPLVDRAATKLGSSECTGRWDGLSIARRMAILYEADFIATCPARGFGKGSQGHPAIRPAFDWFLACRIWIIQKFVRAVDA
jgi:hypothetical protein